MKVLFIEYPKCSTCQKARKWLDGNGVVYESRHIVENNPKAEELRTWWQASGLPLRRFFNTSGMLYRELNVKAQLDAGMTDDEALELLATNGMLVKRPLVISQQADGSSRVLVGFKEADWQAALL
ncbi:MAG: arsenate reductase family protein [Eggerthellaceae bacterium]|nr:arsenate reductase family protein [Eggerthellaceae bacterium]